MTDTLVVTSCLTPSIDTACVSIRDHHARLEQLCCSLLAWANEKTIKKVIVCDNSDPQYNFLPLRQLFDNQGKQLEILLFRGDTKKTAEKGKGYGEGEILKHILENSKLIGSCKTFFKVTGRVYVKNFEEIEKLHQCDDRVFDNPIPTLRRFAKKVAVSIAPQSRHGIGRVNTVLYKCDREFFMHYLLNRYELVNDAIPGRTLEHVYFRPLIRKGFSAFKTKPVFVGYSGTTGRLYTEHSNYSYEVKIKAEELASLIIKDANI